MTLAHYHAKRDFAITPEPRGTVRKSGTALAFYVQRHDASHLHFDFRLELDGTLKSWAIPKGPSLNPADKRLAVHVEDHPLDYGTFEGSIPAHQYGAGNVLLWDCGIWTPDVDPHEGYRKGNLKFHLQGEKLSGGWALVRMGSAKDAEDATSTRPAKENWLLIKERDGEARTGDKANITLARTESVASPKKKKIAAAQPNLSASAIAVDPHGAAPAAMPLTMAPQLATLSDRPPVGDAWLTELKFDGYRALCRIEDSAVSLFTRNGNDWTAKWRRIAEAARGLAVDQAWLDGEIVALDADGKSSFQALQSQLKKTGQQQLVYYVFDLVYLNGFDLSSMALIERKRLLAEYLAQLPADSPIRYSDHLLGNAQEVFDHAAVHGLEGVIAKRASSYYSHERSRDWLKVKTAHRQEFVIGGYTDPAAKRDRFGALLLGVYDAGELRYAGRVGTGFDQATLDAIFQRAVKLETSTTPFAAPPTGISARGVHWLEPLLVAEVKFAEWTSTGAVRHAVFIALREDKPARQIRRETSPIVADRQTGAQQQPARDTVASPREEVVVLQAVLKKDTLAQSSTAEAKCTVAGVELTHPSRILFAQSNTTKRDLARYYEQVAVRLLPHLQNRPLSLVRCPHGGGTQCFFQKHVTDATAAEIDRIQVPEDSGTATYMMANTLEAVISMVQMGVLELHTWGASANHLTQPDRLIFDLDPAPDVAWQDVIDAALLMRSLLEQIGLLSFVKTTGGKGLHVVVPIRPHHHWDIIKPFTRKLAEHLATLMPQRFTAKMAKELRGGKIFIDYLRNGVGATAVAAYSTRAHPNAPVSTPIGWDELGPKLRSDTFTLSNLGARLAAERSDPWKEYFSLHQRVTQDMLNFGVR